MTIKTLARKGTEGFDALETVLKGMEVPLPGGAWFEGKDGHPRYHPRLRWWHQLHGEHPLTWLGLVKVGVDVEAALVKALKGIPASP